MKNIKSEPGEAYDRDQAKRDFEKVLGMGAFDKPNCKLVTVTGPRDGITLIFYLKELPK